MKPENTDPTFKKEVEKRLKESDPRRWAELSNLEKEEVANEYIRRRSIEHLGIDKILGAGRSIKIDAYFVLLGLVLGVFGNIVADVLQRHTAKNTFSDILSIGAFILLIVYTIRKIEKADSEILGKEKIIDKLLAGAK